MDFLVGFVANIITIGFLLGFSYLAFLGLTILCKAIDKAAMHRRNRLPTLKPRFFG